MSMFDDFFGGKKEEKKTTVADEDFDVETPRHSSTVEDIFQEKRKRRQSKSAAGDKRPGRRKSSTLELGHHRPTVGDVMGGIEKDDFGRPNAVQSRLARAGNVFPPFRASAPLFLVVSWSKM